MKYKGYFNLIQRKRRTSNNTAQKITYQIYTCNPWKQGFLNECLIKILLGELCWKKPSERK